jgi:hypothetical protein
VIPWYSTIELMNRLGPRTAGSQDDGRTLKKPKEHSGEMTPE